MRRVGVAARFVYAGALLAGSSPVGRFPISLFSTLHLAARLLAAAQYPASMTYGDS